MHVLIIGAGGMIGAKLAQALAERGVLRGQPIMRMTLADIAAPMRPVAGAMPIDTIAADISDPVAAQALADLCADVIYHLAAIVSG